MSKRQVLVLLGVWVMLLLFLGFPGSWDKPILLITGLLIAFMAYRLEPASPVCPAGRPAEPAIPADAPYAEHHLEPSLTSPDAALQDMIPPTAPSVPPRFFDLSHYRR